MSERKRSATLGASADPSVAEAVGRDGTGRSGTAARYASVLETGLDAVRDWEAEHGELSRKELTWADDVLSTLDLDPA